MPKTASRAPAVASAPDRTTSVSNAAAGPRDPAAPTTRAADTGEPTAEGKPVAESKPVIKSKKARLKASRQKPPAAAPAGSPAEKLSRGSGKRRAAAKKPRRPSRKTFLVAATRPGADGGTALQVYAAVTRSPTEALAAVRAALGLKVAVELTGKLSNRMAKSLGLKPDEVRAI